MRDPDKKRRPRDVPKPAYRISARERRRRGQHLAIWMLTIILLTTGIFMLRRHNPI